MGLSEIQRAEIERGVTWSEAIGAAIEGIPSGSQLSRLADVETPRGNLEETFGDIKGTTSRIRNIVTAVNDGSISVEAGDQILGEIEDYISIKEARLQMLIINSPSLNFNSDRVNSFETDILTVKERLFRAKGVILEGQTKQLTPVEMMLKLQEQQDPDWATEKW